MTDLFIYAPDGGAKIISDWNVETDAIAAVVSFDRDKTVKRVFFTGGSYLTIAGNRYEARALKGKVTGTTPDRAIVQIDQLDGNPDASKLSGRIVFFDSDHRRTAHPVASTKSDDHLSLTLADDLLIGRARINAVEDQALATTTAMPFAPLYVGATISTLDHQHPQRVKTLEGGKIILAKPLAEKDSYKAGQDVWFNDVGPGDDFECPALFFQEMK